MKHFNYLIGLGLAAAVAMPASASDGSGQGTAPELSARGQALVDIESNREAVIKELSAAVPLRDADSTVAALRQLENHELIDLAVDGDLRNFGTVGDNANLVYSALDEPCRILDTRAYSGNGAIPILGNTAREVWAFNIPGQGGDSSCTTPLFGKSALVVALTALSPSFPGTFTGPGYGTIFNGSVVSNGDWSQIASGPNAHFNYTYNLGFYADALSVVWDAQTSFVQTLAVVSTQAFSPQVALYSVTTANYTIDVVGYYDDPELCDVGKTLINGQCWGSVETADTWFNAGENCANQGGRLPTADSVIAAERVGDLPNAVLWGAGWYNDNETFRGMSQSNFLAVTTTTTPTEYRCVFTPLTHP